MSGEQNLAPSASAPLPAPIVLTAQLPPGIFSLLDDLRRRHFPPERNVVPAHCTLFHSLPPSCERELRALIADLSTASPPPAARFSGILNLGSGTAVAIDSEPLSILRAMVAERFSGSLTSQDAHTPRLHVTIQNKVASSQARKLQRQLIGRFAHEAFRFSGIAMYYYRGGPWEKGGEWPFRGDAKAGS